MSRNFNLCWRVSKSRTYIVPTSSGEEVGLVYHEHIEDNLKKPQLELSGCTGNLIEEQLK